MPRSAAQMTMQIPPFQDRRYLHGNSLQLEALAAAQNKTWPGVTYRSCHQGPEESDIRDRNREIPYEEETTSGSATLCHESCGPREFLVPDLRAGLVLNSVQSSAFRLTSVLPEIVPILVDMNGPQTHHTSAPWMVQLIPVSSNLSLMRFRQAPSMTPLPMG